MPKPRGKRKKQTGPSPEAQAEVFRLKQQGLTAPKILKQIGKKHGFTAVHQVRYVWAKVKSYNVETPEDVLKKARERPSKAEISRRRLQARFKIRKPTSHLISELREAAQKALPGAKSYDAVAVELVKSQAGKTLIARFNEDFNQSINLRLEEKEMTVNKPALRQNVEKAVISSIVFHLTDKPVRVSTRIGEIISIAVKSELKKIAPEKFPHHKQRKK